ncbi:MAG: aminopeptidase P family protein [Pseudomonadota bacterium]
MSDASLPEPSAPPSPGPTGFERLEALRAELVRRKLDGFVIPRADEHQGEYVAPRARRLEWLTGFSGSAGMAVVLTERAAIFVDGRYTLQVRAEVDTVRFEPMHLIEEPPAGWLAEVAASGARIGFDPWLHTPDQVDTLRHGCDRAGAELVACETNPIDTLWTDQPGPPLAPVVPHPIEHAGRSSGDKRAAVAATLAGDRLDAAVLSDPASVAWLLNIRGADVEFTPLPLCFAILHADARVELFLDAAKPAPGLAAHLGPEVTVRPPAEFLAALDSLAGRAVRVDRSTVPFAVHERLRTAGARVDRSTDPCALPKACKNEVELSGARAAHRRDGAALVRFLAWLDGRGDVDELTAADGLEEFRRQGALFQGLSFPTIAGAGPNGAIVHYRSTPATNRRLERGQLFLLDSGAQYLDGTTDVTRTVAIGPAGDEERHRYTLVLKGHVAVSTAVFPAGTAGHQLDVLARAALWAEGLDYDHGTGHGVGSFLSVHEGPQRISKSGVQPVALKPGMVLSNEPGYYKTGAYGIRIENLVAVAEADMVGAECPMLRFETLTLVPYDRGLIDPALLTESERAFVDAYHARVAAEIGPLVDDATRAWLARATAPLPV